jgi:hypothetical protein
MALGNGGGAWVPLGAVAVVALILAPARCVGPSNLERLEAENRLLRAELSAQQGGQDGACAVRDGGPRVLCAMRGGALSRMELQEDEHLVRGPRLGAPIKRAKQRRMP